MFFFQDEDVFRVDCIPVSIPITNDDVNEAQQDFVIQLSVVSLNVEDHGRISLSRNISLARIIDDDRKQCMTLIYTNMCNNRLSTYTIVLLPFTTFIVLSLNLRYEPQ